MYVVMVSTGIQEQTLSRKYNFTLVDTLLIARCQHNQELKCAIRVLLRRHFGARSFGLPRILMSNHSGYRVLCRRRFL